ncbi:MAG: MATE family efflux transporter [Elusimicrobiota bacterium]
MAFQLPDRREMRSVLALAAPIALMQLGLVSYGVADTLFMGRLGAWAVAGVGVGGATYFALFISGIGTLLGIDTLSSRAYGAGRPRDCAAVLMHAVVLAVAVSSALFGLLHFAGPFYRWVGVEPSVADVALEYLGVLKWMMFPGLLFAACRQYLQSMDVTRPQLWAIVSGNVLNVLLNYALVFGKLSFPALGVVGCALASVVSSTAMLAVVAAAASGEARRAGFAFRGWRARTFRDLLRLGMPVGGQILIEVSAFSLVTTLMGRFGPVPTAAHQITMNLASVTFMVPLGIGAAAAVRVGQAIGRGDSGGAARAGDAALLLAVLFMGCASVAFWTLPAALIRLYTPDAAVAALGATFLRVAALFQIFDGMQIVLAGALRGVGETRIPLLANAAGHAVLGLPLGYWLAFSAGAGPRGLWFGLLAGLALVAVSLFAVWRRRALSAGRAQIPALVARSADRRLHP